MCERWSARLTVSRLTRTPTRFGMATRLVASMPVPNCPSCGQPTARYLSEASKGALVDYWACPECSHVWHINKQDPAVVTHVKPLKKNDATTD